MLSSLIFILAFGSMLAISATNTPAWWISAAIWFAIVVYEGYRFGRKS